MLSLLLLASSWAPAAFAQVSAEQVTADAAAVTLKVGSGQQYGSLQGALDAIPGSVTAPHRVLVYPGTYTGEATLSGKSIAGGSITIENAQATKPLFTGATLVDGGQWTPTATPDVWVTSRGNVKVVTDRELRMVRTQSLAELARTTNAWYGDGANTYVRLFDLSSPNNRALALTTADFGLRVNVPATIKGLTFEHYASVAVWVQGAGGSNLQSIWAKDVGRRGADDGGILVTGSPNTAVVNAVVSEVQGSGVRVSGSSGVQVQNGSFFGDTVGVSWVGSSGGLLRNNNFGLGFEAAVTTDGASEAGMVSDHNVYGNVTGLTGVRNGSPYDNPQAGAGGEVSSQLADPKYRSTSSAYPSEVTWMLDTLHDQDVAYAGGNGWAGITNAANLAWDWGFQGTAYVDMYRATGDTRWLAKVVSQADQIWANAFTALPGQAPDGKLHFLTSRYAVALISPSTPSAPSGGLLYVVDSNGSLIGTGSSQRIYGPGNGDDIPTITLELRFNSSMGELRYEIWSTTGTPACTSNCGVPADNWNDGTPPGASFSDTSINDLAKYNITLQIGNSAPGATDTYKLTILGKKNLEYSNIDARVTAPMADFAQVVLHDQAIAALPVAGTTFGAKAAEYLSKIDANVFSKWQPYFKDLATTPGANGSPGGVYVYPSDPQYALPSNTNPLNMQADMGRLWALMYSATGDTKYSANATLLATFVKSKLQVKTRNGQEYYYWLYYNQAGSWDTWTQTIPEDINHGGLVANFAKIARDYSIVFNDADLVRLHNTFSQQVWDAANQKVYYYLDRTTGMTYGGTVYWLHDWMDLPGGEDVAKLVYSTYLNNAWVNSTGVVYQTLAAAALKLGRVPGAGNYRVRPGSPSIRAGTTTPYDLDFDARSRSALGTFDVGAFSYIPLTRIAGKDRYDTAVRVSKDRFPAQGSASGVVLTRGDVFADGLAGAALAAQKNASVLLTKPTELPSNVLGEVQRVLQPGDPIWILGGTSAVSQAIADQLIQAGFKVERLSGADRYATAAAIAVKMGPFSEVFIANGSSFADPLAASAAAVKVGAPILLVKTSSIPQSAVDVLTANAGATAHLVGGKTVLDDKLSKSVQAIVNWTDRYGGSNRYGTATTLAAGFFSSNDSVGFATGANFPDALVAGAHVGGPQIAGPLLLVQTTAVPKEVSDYLKANGSRVNAGFIYGGTSAVSQSTEDKLESSL